MRLLETTQINKYAHWYVLKQVSFMDKQNTPLSSQDTVILRQTKDHAETNAPPASHPPVGGRGVLSNFSPFWRDRLVEGGFILSMLLYYIVANPNLTIHLN